MNADVGLEHPIRMSPIAKHISRQFNVTPYREGSDNKEEIAQNLKGLTHGIPEYAWMGDVPR